MRTIGDIARATANQIETYPIPIPKLVNIQKALETFSNSLTIIPVANTSRMFNSATDNHDKLYDVETLINSLDCDKMHLHDGTPKRQICSQTQDQFSSNVVYHRPLKIIFNKQMNYHRKNRLFQHI